jgi:hypothetical protein
MRQFLRDVEAEVARAGLLHAPLNSYHESYAVILEELDEFWEICRQKTRDRDPKKARAELVQIAAMACRAAKDIGLEENP